METNCLDYHLRQDRVFDRIWKRAVIRVRDLCLEESASCILLICHFVSVYRPVDASAQGVIVFCPKKGAIEKNDLFYGIN